MKKRIRTITLVAVIILAFALSAGASDTIGVTINGQAVVFPDQAPVIRDGRTLVPVRGVFEHLGFEVDWDDVTRTAVLSSDMHEVRIPVGSDVFTTNGVEFTLDVPAQLIGGRTMVPIRLPLESVGLYVDWDDATRTVLVSAESFVDAPEYITIGGERFSTARTELRLVDIDLTDEEIALLRYMTNLRDLWLERTQISDLSLFAELTNLDVLILIENQISDLAPLAGLTNLTTLALNFSQISDLTPLAGLTNLTDLSLWDTQISDLMPLAELTNLGRLVLGNNQISNIMPLAGLTNLTYLYLDLNQISDITPLAGLTSLTELQLSHNQIGDLAPLTGLTNLMWLSLWDNQISDLTPLAGLTNLYSLDLRGNQISDLTPLTGLVNLIYLTLNYTPITDWSPVEHVEWVEGRPD